MVLFGGRVFCGEQAYLPGRFFLLSILRLADRDVLTKFFGQGIHHRFDAPNFILDRPTMIWGDFVVDLLRLSLKSF